ncbi:MAG TPA: GNAT family N-acetyltransferase [Thermomicrobiales bacterium]|nr:GNAT family N-acetyltransferase [Thermomicrobiales bacterium]
MESITIRPARAGDATFIRHLYHDVEANGAPAWRNDDNSPYTDQWIDHVIANNPVDQALLVAITSEGEPLGYVWVLSLLDFDTVVPRGHIAGVGVSQAARGKGVGGVLVAAAEAWCIELGLPEVSLHCYLGNTGAYRLYQRLGYQDEWIRMRKALA